MGGTWKVHADQGQGELVLSDDQLRLEMPGKSFAVAPAQWADVTFPNAYCAVLPREGGGPLQVGFASRDDQKVFVAELEQMMTAKGLSSGERSPSGSGSRVLLFTIAEIPGRRVVEALGLVTAQSVMSRGFFSDAGSDLKSLVGGNLVGMERAVGEATDRAGTKLAAAAHALGADAVVGVSVSIAGVGEKAEAIVMAGTAVRTRRQPAVEDAGSDPAG